METNLIAGYLAYTTTDEYGTGASAEGPAASTTVYTSPTLPPTTWSIHVQC